MYSDCRSTGSIKDAHVGKAAYSCSVFNIAQVLNDVATLGDISSCKSISCARTKYVYANTHSHSNKHNKHVQKHRSGICQIND